ncbi:MAG TPA: 16S rRNA (guanine(527)-N(7))-methyltransferase RsmG [Balneolaceae bacterium]|nr:16S rRNA (guanine(527)-N(7))-methyltransferase RsmG [Balneolaceae bacterium]
MHKIKTHHVSRETFTKVDELVSEYRERLESYLDQLLWWNKRVNLVSRNVSRETIREHIRHSLVLSQFEAFKSAELVVDAGTGGGLPGLPLAITHPKKHFVLNDLVTKKCLAMKQIAQKLRLTNLGIIDGSIEDFEQDHPFLLISKHAFKINELYRMTASLPWKNMVLYKGDNFEKELEGIEKSLQVDSYDLSEESEFYQGKALVFVSRSDG